MTRDQALSKIKKCLALAKSSNPHEAAAAMRQAQKLMAEHSLSETDITLADVLAVATPARHQTMTPWEVNLCDLIGDAFGCQYFCRTGRVLTKSLNVRKKMEYIFVGVGAAPQVASYTYDVLSRQCAGGRLEHIRKQPKNCKPITKTARGDEFARGWVIGVRGLIESFAGSERDQVLTEQFMATRYPALASVKVKDRTKGRNVAFNDSNQGYDAGKQAQLNRGVGGVPERGLLT
ncbi:MAG: DUF2786 domain-containing protein [Rhodoferax sp.]|nr:DUF2786 domain-containing protein [Rhodoferax sp.]MDP3652430.1 DUF2786 domain-containing protein [Rhodoferax sp.]